MARSNNQILTVAQMQAAEQRIFDSGTSVETLMERAGRGAAEYVWRIAAGRRVTVLCGPGNNGGDGYVIARTLAERGLDVRVIAPMDPATDAAKAMRAKIDSPIATSGDGSAGHVLVDCLFGSGLSRPLSAEIMLLLRDLSNRHDTHIAIDMPSGIDSDSGQALNDGLPVCDITLALGAWKYAHWMQPANALMGAMRLLQIGVDPMDGAGRLLCKPSLHPPSRLAHKYTRGMCAIVAGAMPGAAQLAAQSAQDAGAGYVKLFADQADHADFEHTPDLVVETGDLSNLLADERINAVLIGPGLGRGEGSRAKLRAAMNGCETVVLDADALMILTPNDLRSGQSIIATPHEGELARLCEEFAVIGGTKLDRARALARQSGMVIVAKGADTIIASPDGELIIAQPATSWLSTAGTGDVLAGIAVSRFATGSSPIDAACEAVWLHGEAARLAGAAFSAGKLARHVSNALGNSI